MAVVTGIEFPEICGSFLKPLWLKIKFDVHTELDGKLEWKVGLSLNKNKKIYTKLKSLEMYGLKKDSFTLNFNVQLPQNFKAAEKRIRGTNVLLISGELNGRTFYQNFSTINVFYHEPHMDLMPPPGTIYKKMVWKVTAIGDDIYGCGIEDVYIMWGYLLNQEEA